MTNTKDESVLTKTVKAKTEVKKQRSLQRLLLKTRNQMQIRQKIFLLHKNQLNLRLIHSLNQTKKQELEN